jgi:uncharacterized protein (TIRG00374 family)
MNKRVQMKFLLKLVITLSLVAVIVWHLGGLAEVGRLMARITPLYVFLILMVNTLDRSLMTFKWGWLLRGRGVHLPFFCGMRIYCASMVWGMFLPATVGADAIRAISTSRMGLDANEVFASIIIERIVGFLSALVLGLLSFVLLSLFSDLGGRFNFVGWLGSAMVAGTLLLVAASFSQSAFDLLHDRLPYRFRDTRLIQRLRQLHSTYRAYQHDKSNLALFFGLTFGEQLLTILLYWLIAHGLRIEISLFYMAGAVPLTILVARLPVSVNGWGVFDGVFMLLMSLAGISAAEAIAIVLIGRILQTVSWLPWWGAHVLGNASRQSPSSLAGRG